MNEPFAFYEESAAYVRARMPFAPQIAVILGSSLGPFAENLRAAVEIDYHDIPNFPVSTAPGHAGKLIFGELAGKKRAAARQQRIHDRRVYRGGPVSGEIARKDRGVGRGGLRCIGL